MMTGPSVGAPSMTIEAIYEDNDGDNGVRLS